MAATALALVGSFAGSVHAGPQVSNWSVSSYTGLAGGCPIESRDGNNLLVAGGFEGSLDIFFYERKGRADSFGDRSKVDDPVSKPAAPDGDVQDFCPTPLPGQLLLFVSNRDGDCGETDIYASR